MSWWISQGYHPFDAGEDGYPLPGQVVQYYRKAKRETQKTLAQELQRSENAVRAMQNQGSGMDSFALRRALAKRYGIPLVLLGLDDRPLIPYWWTQEIGQTFDAGKDGYPEPGQVVKHYRKIKKHGGRRWTQVDLAEALEVTEKTVRDMEKKNTGLDSISRRRVLAEMLSIPPALFGLATVEATLPRVSEVQRKERVPLNIHLYAIALPTYWETHLSSTAKSSVQEITLHIERLQEASLYATGAEKGILLDLLCRYHLLLAFIIDDYPQFTTALFHLNRAALLAQSLENRELLAAVLYRRGNALFVKGDITEALQDYQLSLNHAVTKQLQGALFLKLGQAQATAAQSPKDFTSALNLIDKGGRIAQQGGFEDDEHFLRLRVDRYHLDKAAALLHSPLTFLHYPDSALDELAYATGPDVTCRSAYNEILQARAYLEKGFYPIATSLAEEVLPLVKEIQSGVNLGRIVSLHSQLAKSSYGESPDVARLGRKLLPGKIKR